MLGNMLISGRNSGQVRLAVHGPGNFQAIATKAEVTLEGIIRDAELKLAELRASPSPIETEIKFVEDWLKMAYDSLKLSAEEATGATSTSAIQGQQSDAGSASGASTAGKTSGDQTTAPAADSGKDKITPIKPN